MMTLTKEDLAAIEGLFTGKFEGIEDHFGKIDERLDGMDERFDGLERTVASIDLRLEHVESDVSSLKVGQMQLTAKVNMLSAKLDATYELALENRRQIKESKKRLDLQEG